MSSSAVAELPDDLDIELPIDSRQALESVEAELAQNRALFRSLVCVDTSVCTFKIIFDLCYRVLQSEPAMGVRRLLLGFARYLPFFNLMGRMTPNTSNVDNKVDNFQDFVVLLHE